MENPARPCGQNIEKVPKLCERPQLSLDRTLQGASALLLESLVTAVREQPAVGGIFSAASGLSLNYAAEACESAAQ
jgi:hypothetical protein